MDKLQLLILKNQYEILSNLKPEEPSYQLAYQAIDRGYEHDIEELIDRAVVEPVSMEICQEVRSILDMYRNLQNSLRKAGLDDELIKNSLFPGFDGNEETEHYSYTIFLLEDKGLWRGLEGREQKTWNSHCPMLRRYRAMLPVYRESGSFPLSVEAVNTVLEAGDQH